MPCRSDSETKLIERKKKVEKRQKLRGKKRSRERVSSGGARGGGAYSREYTPRLPNSGYRR